MQPSTTVVRACVLLGCVLVASCGGGGGGGGTPPPAPTPPPPTFAVGGTVNGLFGTGLVLENNGGNPLTVTANGTITFTTTVASGAAYNVAVRTQPTATPAQICTVNAGSGTVGSGPVTSVAVQCRAQAGRFAYVAVASATPAARGVAAFTIDANTGVLTPMANSPFPTTGQSPRVLIADRAGKFLYVYGDNDINAPGATTLTGFTVHPQTGALTAIPGLLVDLAAALAPGARHPNGNFLYLTVSDGAPSMNNTVRGFRIDATSGMLTEVTVSPNGPIQAGIEILYGAVLSPSGATLYVASATPVMPGPPTVQPNGRITRFAVDPQTGALSATGPDFTMTGNAFYGLFMHPAGTHMYTRNSNNSAPGGGAPTMFASRLTLDAATGAIGAKLDIATAFGFGLVIAPAGRVYFEEFGGTFPAPQPGSVYGYADAASGPMTALASSPYATLGSNSVSRALAPTGRFLALTNVGSPATVTVFRIDPAQGALAHVAGSPYAPAVGTAPGSVSFDPSARFAYLTDGAGSISSYSIDVDTGVPTFVSSQPIGGSPAVVPVTILGLQ